MVCLLGFKRDWIAASKRVLKEARLLLAIACSTKAADYNVINLDNNTLKMVTGKDIPVFVRFDKTIRTAKRPALSGVFEPSLWFRAKASGAVRAVI